MSRLKKVVEAIIATRTYVQASELVDASPAMMSKINQSAIRAGLTLEELARLPDEEIQKVIYGEPAARKAQPDWDEVQKWLNVHRKVTLKMAYEKYCEANKDKDTYSYARFCSLYNIWHQTLAPVAHSNMHYWAGQRFDADYSGDPITFTDPQGVEHVCQLYLGISAWSQAMFAYATEDQSQQSWLKAFRATFEYFGKVPSQLVFDNTKALVSKITPEGAVVQIPVRDLCNYYGVTPCPCPPKAPKCKSRVEHAVGIAQKELIAAVALKGGWKANDIDDFNRQLAAACDKYNGRPERDENGVETTPATGKWKLYQEELPFLADLPAMRYEIGEWKKITADSRHCVRINGDGFHRYSVPPDCARQKMWVHILETKIVIVRADTNQQVAVHLRHTEDYGEKTHLLREHMTVPNK